MLSSSCALLDRQVLKHTRGILTFKMSTHVRSYILGTIQESHLKAEANKQVNGWTRNTLPYSLPSVSTIVCTLPTPKCSSPSVLRICSLFLDQGTRRCDAMTHGVGPGPVFPRRSWPEFTILQTVMSHLFVSRV